ncbi:MAG: magnesium transporter [Sphingobacteriales bacterium]|jgi:magnesium transporter
MKKKSLFDILPSISILTTEKRQNPGQRPGTFHVTDSAVETKIEVNYYNRDVLEKVKVKSLKELSELVKDENNFTFWIDIKGHKNVEFFKELAHWLELNKLELEDITHTQQRPKIDIQDNHVFMLNRMLYFENETTIHNEQIAIVLYKNMVVTIQENYDDCFEPLRERLKDHTRNLRNSNSAYLFYAIYDVLIDNFYPVLEHQAEQLDRIDESISETTTKEIMYEIQSIKRTLITLKKGLKMEPDKINELLKCELFSHHNRSFLKDLKDNIFTLNDRLDHNTEYGKSLMEFYLSLVSYRTNEVMKVLTVVSAIFIPLTFIAGIYGMNFASENAHTGEKLLFNMPELYSPYGYFIVVGIMLLIGLSLLVMFKLKGWFK